MLNLGTVQTLTILKQTDFGVYLYDPSGSEEERVLLPKKEVPEDVEIGDDLPVFLYKDSSDRLIATTAEPKLTIGTTALLTVKEESTIGLFLDWGLAKDLLLPFKEQTYRAKTGDSVLVSLYVDKSSRLCATMKVYPFLKKIPPYQKDDYVDGLAYEDSKQFGTFIAVDNCYSALVPRQAQASPIPLGSTVHARVTDVRPDGKLTLTLQEKAYIQMDKDSALIYEKLTEAGGFLPYHDKTDPEVIRRIFGLSKNAYKRAIGRLMKEKKILIGKDGITKL
jgi:hypothetical protein